MNIRDRIRRARERNRKVNEIADRQLTPELKLELIRNRDRARVPMWIIVLMIVNLLITVVLVGTTVDTSAGLKEHFGENVWENIQATGHEKVGGSLQPALHLLVVMIMAMVILETFYIWRDGKEYARLKREILAQHGAIK